MPKHEPRAVIERLENTASTGYGGAFSAMKEAFLEAADSLLLSQVTLGSEVPKPPEGQSRLLSPGPPDLLKNNSKNSH